MFLFFFFFFFSTLFSLLQIIISVPDSFVERALDILLCCCVKKPEAISDIQTPKGAVSRRMTRRSTVIFEDDVFDEKEEDALAELAKKRWIRGRSRLMSEVYFYFSKSRDFLDLNLFFLKYITIFVYLDWHYENVWKLSGWQNRFGTARKIKQLSRFGWRFDNIEHLKIYYLQLI